ncbi:hypothetical protein [Virgibacillus profundi]|nr:hypothetical protein [Virgibacillus profundi]
MSESQGLYKMYLRGLVTFEQLTGFIHDKLITETFESLGVSSEHFK